MVDALSGGALEQAPRWDLVDTGRYSGGIRFFAPASSRTTRSHLEAFSGSLLEEDSITEGLYINLAALPMMCE